MKEEVGKVFEIIGDLAEAGLDQTFVDGFLRDVPVIGTAYRTAMLGKSISDRIFITKLARFLKGIENIPKDEIKKSAVKSTKAESIFKNWVRMWYLRLIG